MIYVVPTPIGNLEDITLRALRILKESSVILCEDPRITKKLFNLLKIESKPKMVALTKNQDINYSGILSVLNEIHEDSVVSLVTDAGTPGMSDPGCEVIRMAQEMKLKYSVLPGCTALVPAVVASGFVHKEFTFMGFLPLKKGRKTAWEKLAHIEYPVVIYESVHRIVKLLQETGQYLLPDQKICICRELTKSFETVWVGTVKEIEDYKLVEKGEFVIIINNI